MAHVSSWQWPLTQAQHAKSDPKNKPSTWVEVFSRATADAFNRAIGEVLDARNPWQLLYRLSRIVFLGLVLYLGWILVVVQPDLARGLMLPQAPKFQQRYSLHREQVQGVLRAAVASPGFGLHAAMVAEWDGAGSVKVLAVQGRTHQHPLEPGHGTLMWVAIAQVMDHVAPGLCENERPSSLAIDEAQLPAGSTLMVEDSHLKMPSFKPCFTLHCSRADPANPTIPMPVVRCR